MSMDDYFYNGELMKCYELAKQVTSEEEKARAQKYMALFEQYDLDRYPKPTAHGEVQHAERADESYPESDLVVEIRAIEEEEAFAKRIQQLEEAAKTGTPSDKAQSFLHKGSCFYLLTTTMRVFTAFNKQ